MALRQCARKAAGVLGLRPASLIAQQQVAQDAQSVFLRAYASTDSSAKYLESHEYAKIEGDIATVGISDHAQAELGDIVYVELPEVGSEVTKSEQFGVVESVKAASDVNSPVTGTVKEVNEALNDEPNKVNSSPFGDGWIMKVQLSDKGELDDLLDAKAYEKHCEENAH